MREAVKVSNDSPVLLDRFLNDAIEVDVDALCDGENVVIGGIMEHIEQAGVHSGDSACSLPPYSLSEPIQDELRRQTVAMAHGLSVVGLMNVQFAIQDGPDLRARGQSARVAHGAVRVEGDRPAAREDRRALHGRPDARGAGHRRRDRPAVLLGQGGGASRSSSFRGVDTILGPEMKSTGEVMGVGETFAEAFLKSQLAAGVKLPERGQGVHQRARRRQAARDRAREDPGRARVHRSSRRAARRPRFERPASPVTPVNKVHEGRPHIVDMMKNDEIALVVNTVQEKRSAIHDSYQIRREALTDEIPTYTTLAGARAAALGMSGMRELVPYAIQALHERLHCKRHACRPVAASERSYRCRDMTTKVPMTVEGAKRLKAELHRLKTVDRPAVIAAIAEARSHGDLAENADYDAAKERQGFIEGRIAEVERRLAHAQVINPAEIDADGRVVFGATVEFDRRQVRRRRHLPDRRRRRGRPEARQDLGELADRASADRQGRRGHGRGARPRRRARVRDPCGSIPLISAPCGAGVLRTLPRCLTPTCRAVAGRDATPACCRCRARPGEARAASARDPGSRSVRGAAHASLRRWSCERRPVSCELRLQPLSHPASCQIWHLSGRAIAAVAKLPPVPVRAAVRAARS